MSKPAKRITSSPLIERSLDRIELMNLDEVRKAGIRRDSSNYHITVMYPPLKAMDEINTDDIFSGFHRSCREFTLYVHIPFCTGKCTFCYFYQVEKPNDTLVNMYLTALKKEMMIVSEKIRAAVGDFSVKSVFFGGGSPTVLSREMFHDLFSTIKEQFRPAPDAEITVEIHPEILRKDGQGLLECYHACGVNRLNIGVQSFDDHILRLTNRRHTAKEAMEVFSLASQTGFHNINIDLLYPLPDLTPEIWESTLDRAFGLEPGSVTTYVTAFKKASPIFKLFQNSQNRFPDEWTSHLLRIMAMEKAGEKQYDYRKLVDWYVKPGNGRHYDHQVSEARKTEDVQLISVGSGVFTYLNHHQYYNVPDIHTYISMLRNNQLPIWKGIRLTKEERTARAVVLGMKSGVFHLDTVQHQFSEAMNARYTALFSKLESLDLIKRENETVTLTDKGILFADEIAVQFITPDIRSKLARKKQSIDPELSLIDHYNFMYDIAGMEA